MGNFLSLDTTEEKEEEEEKEEKEELSHKKNETNKNEAIVNPVKQKTKRVRVSAPKTKSKRNKQQKGVKHEKV